MPSIPSLLRTIDLFSYTHGITYKKSSSQSTACGGILSILSAIFFGFTMVFFGRELYEKNDPIVLLDEQHIPETRVPLRALEVFIVFIDGFGNLIHLDPRFYQTFELEAYRVDVVNVNQSGTFLSTKIDVVQCNDDLISDEAISNHDLKISKEIGLCLNVSADEKIVNEYASMNSTAYIFRLKLCDEAKNPGCREYFQTISNMQSVVYTKEQFFNPGDFHNPVGTRILSTHTDISQGLNTIRSQVVQANEAITDDAVIFSFTNTETFYSISDSNNQTKFFEEPLKHIFELRFEAVKLKKVFKRRYLKIQELIAFAGGFSNGIISLAGFFGKLYGNYSFLVENIEFDCIRKTESNSNRQTSFELKQSKSTERPAIEQKDQVEVKLSFWGFLVGQIFPGYLRKRNIDYNPILRKFDAFHVYSLIEKIEERLEEMETKKNQI